MRWSLRILVVWLLALALPVQALAAAWMAGCGPAPARHTAQETSAHAQAHGHDHAAHAGYAGHDEDGPAQAAPQAAHEADPSGHGEDGRCSACAACCLMAPLPAGSATPGTPALRHAAPQAAPTGTPAFETGGPDRPPRAV